MDTSVSSFTFCLHEADVGDKIVFMARYPLFSIRLRLHENVFNLKRILFSVFVYTLRLHENSGNAYRKRIPKTHTVNTYKCKRIPKPLGMKIYKNMATYIHGNHKTRITTNRVNRACIACLQISKADVHS